MCRFCLLVHGKHGAGVTVMSVSRNTPKGILRGGKKKKVNKGAGLSETT